MNYKRWLESQQVDHRVQAEEAGWAFGTFKEQHDVQTQLG